MREAAKELGIPKAFLFGGPAATFAHYVREDLERERKGLPDAAGRFDYRHDSIFRVNQDIDVALDTEDPELVARFEERMEKFGHFQGDKPAWEARTLRVPMGKTRGRCWGIPDFVNQNSDSHSTGLIEITGNDPFGIRDLRDWDESGQHLHAGTSTSSAGSPTTGIPGRTGRR